MEVTVRGKVDVDNIPDEALLGFGLFVIEKTKEFFGKPENAAKFEEWCENKKRHNLQSK